MSGLTSRLATQLALLDRAVLNLLRRWPRNLVLLVVYVTIVFGVASLLLTSEGLIRLAELTLAGAPDIIVQRMQGGRQVPVPLSYAARAGAHPAVDEVRPRVWGYSFDAATEATYTVLGLPRSEGAQAATLQEQGLLLQAGRLPGPAERTVAVVGQGYALLEGLGPGDEVLLSDTGGKPRPFRIVGLFSAATDLLTHDLLVLPEADVRELFAMDDQQATDLAVRLGNPDEDVTVAARLSWALPDTRAVPRSQLLRTYRGAFGHRSGVVLIGLGLALLAFVVLVWDRAAGLNPQERQEVGVLRAIGWDVRQVLTLKLWESSVIALLAYLLGTLAAYLHVFVLGAPLLRPLMVGWSATYPRLELPEAVSPGALVLLLLCTVLPYAGAALLAAWRIAEVDPEQVVRGLG